MKYDRIELIKMDLTEKSIQDVRDHVKDILIQAEETGAIFPFDINLLQFVIDMFFGYSFSVEPNTDFFGNITSSVIVKVSKRS